MTEETSLSLIKSIINSNKDLVILFKDEDPIATNIAFNTFFNVSSLEEYKSNFGQFTNNFVPHPSYFHKEKLKDGESWFDAILNLPEMDRIVSIMTQNYEPRAFSVNIDNSTPGYFVVTLTDITQDLIKRIMIENNVSLDARSGAYSKKYFLQVAKSYEDAATFNEKIIASIMVHVDDNFIQGFISLDLATRTLAMELKNSIRQDDMLVHWAEDKFLVIYLVDNENNTQPMVNKLQILMNSESINCSNCNITSLVQKKGENINSLIDRVNN